MQFKPSALLAAVAFGVTASAAAFPAPDPVAAPKPDPTADPAPSVSPTNTWHTIDTTGFSAKIVANEESATCSLLVDLPSMNCKSELKDFMTYGYPRPHACWKDGIEGDFTIENQPCTSTKVEFRRDGAVVISNEKLQFAQFQFNAGENAGAYAIVPGEGATPEGHVVY